MTVDQARPLSTGSAVISEPVDSLINPRRTRYGSYLLGLVINRHLATPFL